MAVKVAINGFGRIGRLAFRQMFEAEGYEVVAINDLTSPAMLAHLLKYDTAQGSFLGKIGENKHTVEAGEDYIVVDGKKITIYAKANAAELPWGEIGVDVVLECTGFYTSKAKAQAHIEAGAKKVVISAPAGNDLKTIVYSVNEKTLTAEDQIISAASCTTNCLAPMADTLNKTYPIVSGIMTTVHAYTGDQMILDGPQRKGDKRRARAGAQNIVPNSTGAAKAIGLVIPELNGKLIGSAQRVPVPTGSTTILVAVVKGKDVTKEAINAAMKAAASESFGYNEDPIVSGIMTTVHAYTGDQMILDGPQRKGDLRRARAGAQNIVPNSTGAAKAIGLVIPELNGKLIGSAQRVPVPTGSTTILVAVVKGKDVTKESINAAMKAAQSQSFGYNEEEIVSSDVIGMKYGSLFDATQTMVTKIDDDTFQVQVVSWYDNENSYTSQMVRTIKYFAEL